MPPAHVPWATWQYSSPYLPEAYHNPRSLEGLLNWIEVQCKKGPLNGHDMELLLLVSGLLLRDVMHLRRPSSTLPAFFATSAIDGPLTQTRLQTALACVGTVRAQPPIMVRTGHSSAPIGDLFLPSLDATVHLAAPVKWDVDAPAPVLSQPSQQSRNVMVPLPPPAPAMAPPTQGRRRPMMFSTACTVHTSSTLPSAPSQLPSQDFDVAGASHMQANDVVHDAPAPLVPQKRSDPNPESNAPRSKRETRPSRKLQEIADGTAAT